MSTKPVEGPPPPERRESQEVQTEQESDVAIHIQSEGGYLSKVAHFILYFILFGWIYSLFTNWIEKNNLIERITPQLPQNEIIQALLNRMSLDNLKTLDAVLLQEPHFQLYLQQVEVNRETYNEILDVLFTYPDDSEQVFSYFDRAQVLLQNPFSEKDAFEIHDKLMINPPDGWLDTFDEFLQEAEKANPDSERLKELAADLDTIAGLPPRHPISLWLGELANNMKIHNQPEHQAEKEQLVNSLKEDLPRIEAIEITLEKMSSQQLRNIQNMLTIPEARSHIEQAPAEDHELTLRIYANRPRAVRDVFINYTLFQQLLNNRISPENAYEINQWMLFEVQENVLSNFGSLLQKGRDLNDAKPDTFHLVHSDTDQPFLAPSHFSQEGYDLYFQLAALKFNSPMGHILNTLISEIIQNILVPYTHMLAFESVLSPEETLNEEGAIPTLNIKGQFELVYENRPPTGLIDLHQPPQGSIKMLVTDPITKETRTIETVLPFNKDNEIQLLYKFMLLPTTFRGEYEKSDLPIDDYEDFLRQCNQFEKEIHEAMAIAIYDLRTNRISQRLVDKIPKDQKETARAAIEMMKQGNLFAISDNGGFYLSLIPDFLECSAEFHNPLPIESQTEAQHILSTERETGTTSLPILSEQSLEPKSVTISSTSQEITANTYLKMRVSYTPEGGETIVYETLYEFQPGETQGELVQRITDANMLERDLLLATSHFMSQA